MKTHKVLNIIVTPNGRILIPKSEYKGPVLKLTEEDKSKIDFLKKEIARYELEALKVDGILSEKMPTRERDYYSGIALHLENVIKKLKNDIREIKIYRINQQRKESNI